MIATHSGTFHCDEALATWMLKQTDAFGGHNSTVIRTRDPEILKDADVVVDVGGVYDPGAAGECPSCGIGKPVKM